MGRVTVIAEAGVNHDGSLDKARALVDVAASAGADIVKFQTFRADRIATRKVAKAEYQKRATASEESQHAMLQRLELDDAAHAALIAHCRARGIEFLSTPFDLPSLALLVGTHGLRRLKISSGDLTNGPLLLQAARSGGAIILSTGMAVLGEIEAALGVLAFGMAASGDATPNDAAFAEAYSSTEGQDALRERVTLLHCTSLYPAPAPAVNLRAMDTLRSAFGLPVGYSDHTIGITVALAAVARGAVVIEKHFTLDRSLPGPDHQASLEPDELAAGAADELEDFDLPAMHEAFARAHLVAGNREEAIHRLRQATELCQQIEDPDDRQIIQAQIDSIAHRAA